MNTSVLTSWQMLLCRLQFIGLSFYQILVGFKSALIIKQFLAGLLPFTDFELTQTRIYRYGDNMGYLCTKLLLGQTSECSLENIEYDP